MGHDCSYDNTKDWAENLSTYQMQHEGDAKRLQAKVDQAKARPSASPQLDSLNASLDSHSPFGPITPANKISTYHTPAAY
jgi:hypothetical protein